MRSNGIKLAQFLLGCLWASERIFSFKYDAIWFDAVLYCSDGKSLVSIDFVKRINILSDTRKCRVCRILLCSLKFAIILRCCIKCCLRAVSTGEGIVCGLIQFELLECVVFRLILFAGYPLTGTHGVLVDVALLNAVASSNVL